MYCYHCGLKIDEHKVEMKKSSYFDPLHRDEEVAQLDVQIQAMMDKREAFIQKIGDDEKAKSKKSNVKKLANFDDEIALLNEKKDYLLHIDEIDGDEEIQYVCPRCGHLVHRGLSEEDRKELSRASHAQIQRGSNSFASGMSLNAVGLILLIIGIVFFLLARKPSEGYKLQTDCAEFYVSIALVTISVILLVVGVTRTIIGVRTRHHYSQLLKDLNNKTFVQ